MDPSPTDRPPADRPTVALPNSRRGFRRVMANPLILLNEVWFGIFLMAAIFVYCTLASAGILYPIAWPLTESDNWVAFSVRGIFDMTEMEAFRWWPFNLLIALLCTNLIVVTLKRIPLNRVKFGVWMIHTGILTLAGGSVYYFSTKIEGDTPVFRRQAVIRLAGSDETATLLIRPDAQVSLGSGANTYRIRVTNIMPDWPLLSEEHKGKKAYTVQLLIDTPTEQFIRQLHAGYPQYTEDVLPGKGRAIKTIGRTLVDETLDIQLEYAPQSWLHLGDTFALYVRDSADSEWSQRPIQDVPRYHERISSSDDIWGQAPRARPIDRPIPEQATADRLAGYDVRVTGYLPYAIPDTGWAGGGDKLNPVVRIRIDEGDQQGEEFELAAFIPRLSSVSSGALAFEWAESMEAIEQLTQPVADRLIIRIPGTDIEFDAVMPDPAATEDDPPFNAIEGTDYAYRVRNIIRGLEGIQGQFKGRLMDVAIVDIRTATGEFTRMAANPLAATSDMSKEHEVLPLDEGIEMILESGRGNAAVVTIVAGPEPVGLRVIFPSGEGDMTDQPVTLGEPVTIFGDSQITLTQYLTHGVLEERPLVVPPSRRQAEVGAFFSMIQVELTKDSYSRSLWLKFSHHVLPNRQYEIPGRMPYRTTQVKLADGRSVELMFSRERIRLPNPVVLDDFKLLTHTGGFTGSTNTVRDFVSYVRFASDETDSGWSEPMTVASNSPSENGGYWYFQSTWDPPTPARGDSRGSAGMNYTGLGVGNRNGVYIQLAGTVIAVLGMIYNFYVKPMIIRRRLIESRSRKRAATLDHKTIEQTEPVLTG